MESNTLGSEPAALIGFAIVDALLRKLVNQKTLTASEAANMLTGIIADLRDAKLAVAEKAIPVLEEMLEEYWKQAR